MSQSPGEASGVALPAVGVSPSTPRSIFAFMADALERVRQRAALAELDDRQLRDIGLTRVDLWLDVKKPFWRR